MNHDWLKVTTTLTAKTNAPAAMRVAEGVVSMRDYFNLAMHITRDPDLMNASVLEIEKKMILPSISQSEMLKARKKRKEKGKEGK